MMMVCSVSFAADDHKALAKQMPVAEKIFDAINEIKDNFTDEDLLENYTEQQFPLGKQEKMYQIIKSGNPSCWLGPVWGIANYMVFRGLLRYGFEAEARELAEKTVKLFQRNGIASGYGRIFKIFFTNLLSVSSCSN